MNLDNWQIKDVNGAWVPVHSAAYARSLFQCEACGLVIAGARYVWRRGLCVICDAVLPEGAGPEPWAEPCAATLPETTPDDHAIEQDFRIVGGQGRSAESVLFSAWVVFWCVVALGLMGALAWLWQWLGGVQ